VLIGCAYVPLNWSVAATSRNRTFIPARWGPSAGRAARPVQDIIDQTENVLYEAKGVATREAVRMALGQLLDYSRHVLGDPSLAVLLPAVPSADLVALLQENKIGCIYETMLGTFANASS
jgi:hypothetical protein